MKPTVSNAAQETKSDGELATVLAYIVNMTTAVRELRKPSYRQTVAPDEFNGSWEIALLCIASINNYENFIERLEPATATHAVELMLAVRRRLLRHVMDQDIKLANATLKKIGARGVRPYALPSKFLANGVPPEFEYVASDAVSSIVDPATHQRRSLFQPDVPTALVARRA